jgi:hypothetical protein
MRRILDDGEVRLDFKRPWSDGTSSVELEPLASILSGASSLYDGGPRPSLLQDVNRVLGGITTFMRRRWMASTTAFESWPLSAMKLFPCAAAMSVGASVMSWMFPAVRSIWRG